MLIKNEVIKSIQELPDEFSFDEAIDTLLLLDKIEIGSKQSQDCETVSTAEAKEKLSKWLTAHN